MLGNTAYVSARRLFWVIRELQAVANGALRTLVTDPTWVVSARR